MKEFMIKPTSLGGLQMVLPGKCFAQLHKVAENMHDLPKGFKEYHNSREEFLKSYQTIYNWVKQYERVDDTDIHYKLNTGIEIETEEWNKFTDSISEKYEGSEIVDTEASFPKYHFEYGALNVYFMHGQGTACWITYNKQTDRDSKLNEIL